MTNDAKAYPSKSLIYDAVSDERCPVQHQKAAAFSKRGETNKQTKKRHKKGCTEANSNTHLQQSYNNLRKDIYMNPYMRELWL